MSVPTLALGGTRPLDGSGCEQPFSLPAHHLVTHGVICGMTGSGKTGLTMVLVEEALRSRIPVLMIDVKGDLPNLLLAFPDSEAATLAPWIDREAAERDGRTVADVAADTAAARKGRLASWGLDTEALRAFRDGMSVRVLTPGASHGEFVHVLSPLERPSARWKSDPEGASCALSAAVSLVLRLTGRDPDPARSREHVLLSLLAERRLRSGEAATLENLLSDLERPPLARVGAMELDAFASKRDRRELAGALNALLASPTFATWRRGTNMNVGEWLAPRDDGRTPAVIVSVAHLAADERMLVLGMLLEEVLGWVRSLSGTSALRALVVFDEVYGFVPPHPANPPTKRPLVSLMKQARAFGVGVVIATQDPMDLDYRALANAGVWWVGRLQTDADRARVVEGLANAHGGSACAPVDARRVGELVKKLSPRWFVMRDAHDGAGVRLVEARESLAWLRGPMTRGELIAARGA